MILDRRFVRCSVRIARRRMRAAAKLKEAALGDGTEAHRLGALGELLVAFRLGLPLLCVDRGRGRDAGFDLVELGGLTVEVRTRNLDLGDRHRDLIARADRGIRADVAVLVWLRPASGEYWMAGWTTRDAFEQRKRRLERRDGMQLWMMPHTELRPMCELSP